MVLTDWSPDGKFLTFFTGVIVVVPIGDDKKGLERKEIDWLREDYDAGQGRFSPDNRFLAYLSNEADVDRGEVTCARSMPASLRLQARARGAGVEGWLHRHDHVAAGREGTLFHDPQLGSHGRRGHHDSNVQSGSSTASVQPAGSAAR